MTEATLSVAVERLAGELGDVRRRDAGGAVEYLRAEAPFAVREGERLSFRLRREVVEAALRTPDTGPGERGPDWVALAPSTVDEFAVDRATAWFESAWRLAGE